MRLARHAKQAIQAVQARQAGHLGLLAAGVHLLSWCAVGLLAGLAPGHADGRYAGWTDAAWLIALVFLLASAVLFLGVVLGVIRSRPASGQAAATPRTPSPPAAASAPVPDRRAR